MSFRGVGLVFSRLLLVVGCTVAFSTSAFAADGKTLYAAKMCAACHGKDANTPIMPNYPKIGGQNYEYLVAQMRDIKSGARANGQSAAMKGVMHLVKDDEIQSISKWLAGLK